jgi:hypothetical protein
MAATHRGFVIASEQIPFSAVASSQLPTNRDLRTENTYTAILRTRSGNRTGRYPGGLRGLVVRDRISTALHPIDSPPARI